MEDCLLLLLNLLRNKHIKMNCIQEFYKFFYRNCGGRLSSVATKLAQKQHIEPEFLQRRQLHPALGVVFWPGRHWTTHTGWLVGSESYEHSPHVTSEWVACTVIFPWRLIADERRKEMFYLTTHSSHFIYGYMVSDIWLRTILIVRSETCCHHIGYSLWLTARVLLYAPSHRQDSTYHSLCYTIRGALAGTRNSSMGSDCWWNFRGGVSLSFHSLFTGGARCSSVVRAFAYGVRDRRINPSWWTHWAISRSSRCSTTVAAKAVVCVILSVGVMHIKEPFLLIRKSSLCGSSGFPLSLSEWSFTICLTPYNCK